MLAHWADVRFHHLLELFRRNFTEFFARQHNIMRQQASAWFENSAIFMDQVVFGFVSVHRQHRFVNDDIKTCVSERKSGRICLYKMDFMIQTSTLYPLLRDPERALIHIYRINIATETRS